MKSTNNYVQNKILKKSKRRKSADILFFKFLTIKNDVIIKMFCFLKWEGGGGGHTKQTKILEDASYMQLTNILKIYENAELTWLNFFKNKTKTATFKYHNCIPEIIGLSFTHDPTTPTNDHQPEENKWRIHINKCIWTHYRERRKRKKLWRRKGWKWTCTKVIARLRTITLKGTPFSLHSLPL